MQIDYYSTSIFILRLGNEIMQIEIHIKFNILHVNGVELEYWRKFFQSISILSHQIWTTLRLFDIVTTENPLDLRFRSGRPSLLLLVNGRIVGLSLQFLGDNLSICISRNQFANNHRLVLPRLFRRFSLFDRYPVPFSLRIFGRRCAADRLIETTPALYELDNVLYWLPLSIAIRFFIFVDRF